MRAGLQGTDGLLGMDGLPGQVLFWRLFISTLLCRTEKCLLSGQEVCSDVDCGVEPMHVA